MKTFDERRKSVEGYMHSIRKRRRKVLITATSMCLVMALALVLFMPLDTGLPSVGKYKDHAYYELIQKINQAMYQEPEYANRFEKILDQFNRGLTPPGKEGLQVSGTMVPYPEDSNMTGEYVEVTDNQVEGVIESDIFKRTDRYIFYLRNKVLSVYTIDREASALAGEYTLEKTVFQADEHDKSGAFRLFDPKEMYLSQDGTRVTVLVKSFHKSQGYCTEIISLDVTDPANIRETNRVYMSGDYLSSRMVGDRLLVMSRYGINLDQIDFDKPETYIPQVGGKDAMIPLLPDDIASPEILSHLTYTVIAALDGNSLEVEDTAAVLSYSDQLYVSQDTIYATRTFTHDTEKDAGGCYSNITKTEITGIRYGEDGLAFAGSIILDGTVKNQYSMDQYNGILRVVTSTTNRSYKSFGDGSISGITVLGIKRNVNLYCVDLDRWEVTASVESFAPDGEDAQSVRFDGHMAYVCTAEVIVITDPVYFFDLSDLENITYTDTGTIDGYSTSLIELGDGYLLGIGYGDTRQLKVEVYKERDGAVISVCTYQLAASFSEEYKSYYINREYDLIGLPVMLQNGSISYKLLHFDGFALHEIVSDSCIGALDNVRATIIDGYLYILHGGFTVEQVW